MQVYLMEPPTFSSFTISTKNFRRNDSKKIRLPRLMFHVQIIVNKVSGLGCVHARKIPRNSRNFKKK